MCAMAMVLDDVTVLANVRKELEKFPNAASLLSMKQSHLCRLTSRHGPDIPGARLLQAEIAQLKIIEPSLA